MCVAHHDRHESPGLLDAAGFPQAALPQGALTGADLLRYDSEPAVDTATCPPAPVRIRFDLIAGARPQPYASQEDLAETVGGRRALAHGCDLRHKSAQRQGYPVRASARCPAPGVGVAQGPRYTYRRYNPCPTLTQNAAHHCGSAVSRNLNFRIISGSLLYMYAVRRHTLSPHEAPTGALEPL